MPPSRSSSRSSRSSRQDKLDQVLLTMAEVLRTQSQQTQVPQTEGGVEKFKMDLKMTLKKINMKKGQLISPEYVLVIMNQARDINMQAVKAANRMPQSQNEWDIYLKFHLSHMEGELHREMAQHVLAHAFRSQEDFWQAVFRLVFPPFPARSAISKALFGYMVWEEPRGLGRWREVTQDLVEYQAGLSGKEGPDREMALSEGLYLQMTRIISECPESHSAQLKRDFLPYNLPIKQAMLNKQIIPAAQYLAVFEGFFGFLYEWLQEHSYQATFGRKQATCSGGVHTAPQTREASGGDLQPQVRQMTTESQSKGKKSQTQSSPSSPAHSAAGYSEVTESRRDPKPREEKPWLKNPKPRGFSQLAPTGMLRTWTWGQKVRLESGELVGCDNPPPADCDNPKCQYLGDWLDWKGQCTYCAAPGHIKTTCPRLKKLLESWAKRDAQENSQPSAQ